MGIFLIHLGICVVAEHKASASERVPWLRMLVVNGGESASAQYPEFDYLARQLGAQMVYWHTYPREWDVYHLMDSLQKKQWRSAAGQLNQEAISRLRDRLGQNWDLVCWTGGELPRWARQALAERVKSNRALLVFGRPPGTEPDDELARLLAACKTTSNPHVFSRLEPIRVSASPRRLLLFPQTAPYVESAVPERDEIAEQSGFWRELVTRVCVDGADFQVALQELSGRLAALGKGRSDPTAGPTSGAVSLSLTTDRRGGDVGDTVQLTVTAESAPVGDVHLAVADREGRVRWHQARSVRGGTVAEFFSYTLGELGPHDYAYYVTTWLVVGSNAVGRANLTLYQYRPWDMRRQWQWSPWEDLYRWPSFHAAAAMKLFADAGFNSLGTGYATTRSLWWAERYGWRKYAELQGGHKLWNAPVIETEDDTELRLRVRSQMAQMHRYFGNAWPSAALTLGSLGEEPGFHKGWGRTYYWETDEAPPVAQRVFQQFLRERYATVQDLAESWQIPLRDWTDARLLKKYSLEGPKFDPTETIEDAPEHARDHARYVDSTDFFRWYFRKVARLATEAVQEINPAIRTFYSLHGPDFDGAVGVAHMHHLHYPKEYQAFAAARARMRTGGEPCFSLIWNHFDDPAMVSAGLWSQVANQVTHVNFWLGFPLMLNHDLTHTRASMVLKRFLHRFQPVSGLLARATVAPSGAALLASPSLERRFAMRNLQSAYAALAESGFPPAFVDETQLDRVRLVFAQAVTQLGAQQVLPLRRFVENGGVLITTAGFASRTEHGRLFERAPGYGLDEWMGFRYGRALGRTGSFRFGDIEMPSAPFATRLHLIAADVEVLARFADGTPALLHRRIGEGHLYHFNFLHREWGWGMPVPPEREALRRLVAELARRSGLQPAFFIENRTDPGTGMPYWGSQLFVGADGHTHYLVVFNDHRAPPTSGRIHWHAPGWRLDDLLDGMELAWTEDGARLDLTLAPGDGRILRLVPPGEKPEPLPATPPPPRSLPLPHGLEPVVPRGWPSEQWPARVMSESDFIAALERLREIYRTGKTRVALSYYVFDANSDNRHAVTRELAEQPWPRFVPALERALRDGCRFLLTGEDLGYDPLSGLSVTVHRPDVLGALAQLGRQPGATWYRGSEDGHVLLLSLGRGRLVLDRSSLDSVGFYNREYAAWKPGWWASRRPLLESDNPPPESHRRPPLDERELAAWLTHRTL